MTRWFDSSPTSQVSGDTSGYLLYLTAESPSNPVLKNSSSFVAQAPNTKPNAAKKASTKYLPTLIGT